MGEAAVKAAKAVGYSNAGTCEFLLAQDGEFYFLEMNTRLQVEHPVTELVTGVDMLVTQIRVAEGEPLGPELDGIQPRGHAIEVRLYAEDPYQRFAPSPGRIELLRWPDGPGVRVDAGVYEGSEVSIYYDPMLAKLIVWAADRKLALARLGRALNELRVEGIRTTVPLYRALLADPDFTSGNMDIGMLDRKLAAGELQPPPGDEPPDLPLIAAAVAHFERTGRSLAPVVSRGEGRRSRWGLAARREALMEGAWT
jgi:acetyl/propionyl-CoA carboxylase alpha subunit